MFDDVLPFASFILRAYYSMSGYRYLVLCVLCEGYIFICQQLCKAVKERTMDYQSWGRGFKSSMVMAYLSVSFGIDEDHIVSSVVIPRVNQHGVQRVARRRRRNLLQVWVEVDLFVELEPVRFQYTFYLRVICIIVVVAW